MTNESHEDFKIIVINSNRLVFDNIIRLQTLSEYTLYYILDTR